MLSLVIVISIEDRHEAPSASPHRSLSLQSLHTEDAEWRIGHGRIQ